MVTSLGNTYDTGYDLYLRTLQQRFSASSEPVFTTDVEDTIVEVYLSSFPDAKSRQHHTCSACRHFLQRYGGLAHIHPTTGLISSAFWSLEDAPTAYQNCVGGLMQLVKQSKITGVFLSKHPLLGTPETGVWRHFALKNPRPYAGLAKEAHEVVAEKLQDVSQVSRALSEFDADTLNRVVEFLELDTLLRGEKVLGPAKWLRDLQTASRAVRGDARKNVIMRAVAVAPSGFCHPRSSMIGTLLDDLTNGLPFDDASRKFAAKMHPLLYQRPQAAPSSGQIDAAEKLVERLGIADSLKRRFARVDEIPEMLWMPIQAEAPSSEGVFGHLRREHANQPLESQSSLTVSWKKFSDTVLPLAQRIDIEVPSHGNFHGMLTAAVVEAPPILQWDTLEQRNPFSWYVYTGGSACSRWGLQTGWTSLDGITLKPSMWFGDKYQHQGNGVCFILSGAKDSQMRWCAIFPETLKADLHGARAVIEKYSNTTTATDADQGTANGLMFDTNGLMFDTRTHLRVTLRSGSTVAYILDRWD